MTNRTAIDHSSRYAKWPHHDDCLLCQIEFVWVQQADNDDGSKIERKNRKRQRDPIAKVGPRITTSPDAGLIGKRM